MKTEVGKILIDIAKLVFGGAVLAGIIRQDLSPASLVIVGGVITALSISAGLYLIFLDKRSSRKNNKEK